MTLYDNTFYDQITEGSVRSARKVLPYVRSIFQSYGINQEDNYCFGPTPKITSVIDIGCGAGSWLSVCQELGIKDVYGVDGEYVDCQRLLIPQDKFEPHDLSQPYIPLRKYDMAISLEVAEHLPESAADAFVQTLTRCSENILFSAAVPGQNGVGHINEQWPSYWVPKFQALGYQCDAYARFKFWHDEDIENWYRQNILLFKKTTNEWPSILVNHNVSLDVIHYNNWNHKIGR